MHFIEPPANAVRNIRYEQSNKYQNNHIKVWTSKHKTCILGGVVEFREIKHWQESFDGLHRIRIIHVSYRLAIRLCSEGPFRLWVNQHGMISPLSCVPCWWPTLPNFTSLLSPSFLSVTGLGAPLSSSPLKRRYISLQNEWMNYSFKTKRKMCNNSSKDFVLSSSCRVSPLLRSVPIILFNGYTPLAACTIVLM